MHDLYPLVFYNMPLSNCYLDLTNDRISGACLLLFCILMEYTNVSSYTGRAWYVRARSSYIERLGNGLVCHLSAFVLTNFTLAKNMVNVLIKNQNKI